MMLNIFQDSPSLSVCFKSTTARMRRSPKNHPASLSLVLRQWYGFIAIVFCKHGISALLISNRFIKGIMYLGSPFSFTLLQRFPLHRRFCAAVGLVIMTISLVASSFATRVSHLILTQGVLYAIGGSMLYTPTVIFLDEWFIARKGLAFGVMWAGTGKIPSIYLTFDTSSDCDRLQRGFHTLLDELGSQRVLFQYYAARVVCHPFSSCGSSLILRQAPPTSLPNISYTSATLGLPEDLHILVPTNGQHPREPWLLYSEHLPT